MYDALLISAWRNDLYSCRLGRFPWRAGILHVAQRQFPAIDRARHEALLFRMEVRETAHFFVVVAVE
jgi:hypothetical protein